MIAKEGVILQRLDEQAEVNETLAVAVEGVPYVLVEDVALLLNIVLEQEVDAFYASFIDNSAAFSDVVTTSAG